MSCIFQYSVFPFSSERKKENCEGVSSKHFRHSPYSAYSEANNASPWFVQVSIACCLYTCCLLFGVDIVSFLFFTPQVNTFTDGVRWSFVGLFLYSSLRHSKISQHSIYGRVKIQFTVMPSIHRSMLSMAMHFSHRISMANGQ